MNSGPLLFLGLFVTMAISWLSFIIGPQLQLGSLQPTTNVVVNGNGVIYPNAEPGDAHQGAEVYRAEGCASCHTQQVRPRSQGADILRGWGIRRSTSYDYLFDQPAMLGSLRIGPDLANAWRVHECRHRPAPALRSELCHAGLHHAVLPILVSQAKDWKRAVAKCPLVDRRTGPSCWL